MSDSRGDTCFLDGVNRLDVVATGVFPAIERVKYFFYTNPEQALAGSFDDWPLCETRVANWKWVQSGQHVNNLLHRQASDSEAHRIRRR